MKYSIRQNHLNKTMLFENGIQAYVPDDVELEFWARIQELEDVLNAICHSTSCTTHQMELINEVLPQKVPAAK